VLAAARVANDHPRRTAQFVMRSAANDPSARGLGAELVHGTPGLEAPLVQSADDVAAKLKGAKL